MKQSHKGIFKPKNPQKYVGDPNRIIYRSSWERKFMNYADTTEQIEQWSSEELVIKYINPIDRKFHRYFPDFLIKVKVDNSYKIYVVEIKPQKQTVEPTIKRRTKHSIQEALTYKINQAKWDAAMEYCLDRGWNFIIMTEKELGIKF